MRPHDGAQAAALRATAGRERLTPRQVADIEVHVATLDEIEVASVTAAVIGGPFDRAVEVLKAYRDRHRSPAASGRRSPLSLR